MMIILGIVGFIFFGSVGYFAYTFSQCICRFTRLDKIISLKVSGVIGVLVYFYLVYINRDDILTAFLKPFTS